jgi:hypothetical protein
MVATAPAMLRFTKKTELDELLYRIVVKLQLTATQHQLAVDRYTTISKWLSADGSALAEFDPIIYPQGSLRIGTTVKPKFKTEFDLDLVLELRALSYLLFPKPVLLLDLVEQRIKEHEKYRTMYERKNRCIRICYANDFHLDILPAGPDREMGGTCLLVPDRAMKGWKNSNPKGYANWFEQQLIEKAVKLMREIEPVPAREEVEVKHALKQATQLLKRDRDIRYADNLEQAPISIVLTTLAAQHYGAETSVSLGLHTVLTGIVSSFPSNDRLRVYNPSNWKEDLSERWNDNPDAYKAFVEGTRKLRQDWEGLLLTTGINEIAAKLSKLFGEEVTTAVVKERALEMEVKRQRGILGVSPSSGLIVSTTNTGATPIRQNTFYGA